MSMREDEKFKQILKISPRYYVIRENFITEFSENSLFNRANIALKSGDFKGAISLYRTIIDNSGNVQLISLSIYNLALCHLYLGEASASAKWLKDLLDICEGEICTSGKILLVSILLDEGKWEIGEKLSSEIETESLGEENRFHHLINLSRIKAHRGEFAESRNILFTLLKEKSYEGFKYLVDFYMGEAYYEEFERSLTLALPDEESIMELFRLLSFAQNHYLKSMKGGDYHITSAGLYRLGSMYLNVYKTLLSFSPPEDLNEEEKNIYYEELRKELLPLVEKASCAFEKNLELFKKFNIDNMWMKRTQRVLRELGEIF